MTPGREELIEIAKGLEQLRVGNKQGVKDAQSHSVTQTVVMSLELSKQLFVIASALFAFFTALLSIKEVRENLKSDEKLLITISAIFIFASFVFGLFYIFHEIVSYFNQTKVEDSRLEKWSSISLWPSDVNKLPGLVNEYEKVRKEVAGIKNAFQAKALSPFLIGQGLFLLLSFIPLILFFYKLVY